jgi:hypothetical protein
MLEQPGWTNHALASKSSWVTRRIPPQLDLQWGPVTQPASGDVLLCEIVDVSLHGRLELSTGARSILHAGDRIISALGSRYATSFLEGVAEIDGEDADLLSASGICGRVLQRTEKKQRPTRLKVVAQAYCDDRAVNLRAFGLPAAPPPKSEPAWVLVVGSAMDSGKTSACNVVINSLSQSGLDVGAAKLTGIASARDLCSYQDAGARFAADLLDCGWVSTAGCSTAELGETASTLLAHLRAAGVEIAVLEIADGLLQPETAALLSHLREELRKPAVILTARESLAGVAGVERLSALGYSGTVVSGVLTNSPLSCREVELAARVPCVRTGDLGDHMLTLKESTDELERRQLSTVG